MINSRKTKEFLNIALLKVKYPFKKTSIWKNILKEYGVSGSFNSFAPENADLLLRVFNDWFRDMNIKSDIEIKNMAKTYDNSFKAVDKFNLDIKSGEFVCLLGPSGCGKTTILRMLAGFENITGGHYLMDNKVMNSVVPADRNTAMVFQNYALYPFMTVYKNIAFGLNLKTFKNPLLRKYVNEYLSGMDKNYNEIKDLEYKIYLLNHPNMATMNILKIEYKKASLNKIKNAKEIERLSSKIEALKERSKVEKEENQKEIEVVRSQIAKLKEESKRLRVKVKADNKEKSAKINEEIKALEDEEKLYFAKNVDKYNKTLEGIKTLNANKKELEKEFSETLKNGLKQVKAITKDPLSTPDQIAAAKVGLDEKLNSLQKKIDQLRKQIAEKNSFSILMKYSKRPEITELRKRSLTSKELLNLALKAAVVWKKTVPARVRQLARMSGMENYLTRKPSALSGGQRQRVALIRAISKNANLFLFDEPLSNLDAKLRATMRHEIRKIHDQSGATSLYVTHDQIEAMTMATKIVIMNVGFILQVGKPIDLYENPSNVFVAKFIGTPTMNIIKVQLNSAKEAQWGTTKVPMKFSDEKTKMISAAKALKKDVILGIRPQDVVLLKTKSKGAIPVKVLDKELTGADQVLTVALEQDNAQKIRFTISNHISIANNSTIYIGFDPEKIHLFDIETGNSISSIINEETRRALEVWKQSVDTRVGNKMILDKRSVEKLSLTKKGLNKVKGAASIQKKNEDLKKKLDQNTKVYDDYKLAEFSDDINS